MKSISKYYKNLNTGEFIKSQTFTETLIKTPIRFYGINNEFLGENLKLTGFVEISEKKWER